MCVVIVMEVIFFKFGEIVFQFMLMIRTVSRKTKENQANLNLNKNFCLIMHGRRCTLLLFTGLGHLPIFKINLLLCAFI